VVGLLKLEKGFKLSELKGLALTLEPQKVFAVKGLKVCGPVQTYGKSFFVNLVGFLHFLGLKSRGFAEFFGGGPALSLDEKLGPFI
jgi:hypothetical protein